MRNHLDRESMSALVKLGHKLNKQEAEKKRLMEQTETAHRDRSAKRKRQRAIWASENDTTKK